MQHIVEDKKLEQCKRIAIQASNDGLLYSVYNLNPIGQRMLVVREHGSVPARNFVAGPFGKGVISNG